jgi:DNA-binding transcriptional ArsR family regulator
LPKTEQIEKVQSNEELSTIAFLARSLSDENRLRILLFLSQGKESVTRIVEELNLSQPLVSHHLKELKRSLLVKVERNGPFIYYDMTDQRIISILKDLQVLADSLLANRKTF